MWVPGVRGRPETGSHGALLFLPGRTRDPKGKNSGRQEGPRARIIRRPVAAEPGTKRTTSVGCGFCSSSLVWHRQLCPASSAATVAVMSLAHISVVTPPTPRGCGHQRSEQRPQHHSSFEELQVLQQRRYKAPGLVVLASPVSTLAHAYLGT